MQSVGFLRECVVRLESREDLARLCSRRIADREAELRAWVEVSPQAALGQGPLDGIPFGAKDIFETRGLATEFGSAIYAGRKGQTDSTLVTELRQRGAVLMGKTQTTAFASFDPGPTRNPHNRAHTPGGSSSGSAAAVAAGTIPFALGSQTQGSVLRPASYCGVAGFKPTYGGVSSGVEGAGTVRASGAALHFFRVCVGARHRGAVHKNRGRYAPAVEPNGIVNRSPADHSRGSAPVPRRGAGDGSGISPDHRSPEGGGIPYPDG